MTKGTYMRASQSAEVCSYCSTDLSVQRLVESVKLGSQSCLQEVTKVDHFEFLPRAMSRLNYERWLLLSKTGFDQSTDEDFHSLKIV